MQKKTIYSLLVAVAAMVFSNQAIAAGTLDYLNAQRAYFGMRPLLLDRRLQLQAERRVSIMASRERHKHLGGLSGGQSEGIGIRPDIRDHTGQRFFSCMQNTNKRYAGAACVVSRSGRTFYCLMLR